MWHCPTGPTLPSAPLHVPQGSSSALGTASRGQAQGHVSAFSGLAFGLEPNTHRSVQNQKQSCRKTHQARLQASQLKVDAGPSEAHTDHFC